MTGREGVEDLKEFVYLGTTVTKEGSGTEDVKKRLSKAQGAFFNLKKIWNTIAYQTFSINHACKNDAINPKKKRKPLQHLKGVKSLRYT